MARINAADTVKIAKPNKKLRNVKKEVQADDIYTALADLVIDSFLESRNKKMLYLKGAQFNRKNL